MAGACSIILRFLQDFLSFKKVCAFRAPHLDLKYACKNRLTPFRPASIPTRAIIPSWKRARAPNVSFSSLLTAAKWNKAHLISYTTYTVDTISPCLPLSTVPLASPSLFFSPPSLTYLYYRNVFPYWLSSLSSSPLHSAANTNASPAPRLLFVRSNRAADASFHS